MNEGGGEVVYIGGVEIGKILVRYILLNFCFAVFRDVHWMWHLHIAKKMTERDTIDGKVVDIIYSDIRWKEKFYVLLFIPLENIIASVLIGDLPSLHDIGRVRWCSYNSDNIE